MLIPLGLPWLGFALLLFTEGMCFAHIIVHEVYGDVFGSHSNIRAIPIRPVPCTSHIDALHAQWVLLAPQRRETNICYQRRVRRTALQS
jgi:hypothetical protein